MKTKLFENISGNTFKIIKENMVDNWDSPEEKVYTDVNMWVQDNVKDGVYNGEPLSNYGFPYKVGQPIKMEKGYLLLTMKNWNDAKKKQNDNLGLGRPLGFN